MHVHTCVCVRARNESPLHTLSTASPLLTRLSGGGASFGRVEISFDGGFSWNSICDDFFSLGAAKIICRQFRDEGKEGRRENDEVSVVSGAAYGRGRSYGNGTSGYLNQIKERHNSHNQYHHPTSYGHAQTKRHRDKNGQVRRNQHGRGIGGEDPDGCDHQNGDDRRDGQESRDGNDVVGVITDDFRDCKGTEKNILECAKRRKRWKCGREEDVGVVCGGKKCLRLLGDF